MENSVITDWDAMEAIWTHMFYEDLMVPPENFNILHTESFDNSREGREKLVEVKRTPRVRYYVVVILSAKRKRPSLVQKRKSTRRRISKKKKKKKPERGVTSPVVSID